jgi:hypothetical protein
LLHSLAHRVYNLFVHLWICCQNVNSSFVAVQNWISNFAIWGILQSILTSPLQLWPNCLTHPTKGESDKNDHKLISVTCIVNGGWGVERLPSSAITSSRTSLRYGNGKSGRTDTSTGGGENSTALTGTLKVLTSYVLGFIFLARASRIVHLVWLHIILLPLLCFVPNLKLLRWRLRKFKYSLHQNVFPI